MAIHEHVITNNDRLSVTHSDQNTWTLVIKNVKMEDRGQYMCQVNTDPMKMQVIRSATDNAKRTPPPTPLDRINGPSDKRRSRSDHGAHKWDWQKNN